MVRFPGFRRSRCGFVPAVITLAALLYQSPHQTAQAAQWVDMSGETVTIPDHVGKVYASASSAVAVMAALAPDLLVGVYYSHTPQLDRLLPPVMAGLPMMEVNGPQRMNPEKVLAAAPDLTIGLAGSGLAQQLRAEMAPLGIPSFAMQGERLAEYPATFRALGAVLGRAERGERLASWLENAQFRLGKLIDAIPRSQRVRVYYAESPDGLHSQCDSANRAEIITLAGGVNALQCVTGNQMTSTPTVNPEMLLSLDPDVIITRLPATARDFRTDPRWSTLKAVRDGRVHAVPALPFNWFDRPPSYLRAMGALWLVGILYPDRMVHDMTAETRSFFQTFYGISPSDDDLAAILSPEAAP